jgi:hypothetical protein
MTHRTARRALLLLSLLAGRWLTGGTSAAAQDSQLGIRGLGTPGRWESVRARTTGGAFGPFDPSSPLTEAAIADVPQLSATAMAAASYRDVELAGSTTPLRSTRFPLLLATGRVASRLALAVGFTTYLDKTWAVVLHDSMVLRNVLQRYTDEIASDGSIADLRFAAGSRLSRRIAIGAAVHLLAGSTHQVAARRFDDTTFHTVQQFADVSYRGFGVSGSVLIGVAPGLSVVAWGRTDNRLRAVVNDTTSADTPLPRMAGGGVLFAPSASVRFGGAVAWRSWSRAGPGAFDTWSWSTGAEIGAGVMPIRFGLRGGQLPFGPGTSAPTEFAAAAGFGRAFAQGRGLVDLGFERLERRASGLREHVWTVLVGITVRP